MITRALTVLCAAIALSGCAGSLSGVGGTDSFSCPFKPGYSCKSISDVYDDVSKGGGPSKDVSPRDARAAHESKGSYSSGEPEWAAGQRRRPVVQVSQTADAGAPIVRPPRVARMWIAPWRDKENDIHDEQRIYLQVDNGDFVMEPMYQKLRAEYAPIQKTDAAPAPAAHASISAP